MENEEDWNGINLFMLLLMEALHITILSGQNFDIRNPHIMLLNIFDFHEIQHKKGHTFLTGANKNIFAISP
jgi:hypothetical protein